MPAASKLARSRRPAAHDALIGLVRGEAAKQHGQAARSRE
jgi:hypothetical protein